MCLLRGNDTRLVFTLCRATLVCALSASTDTLSVCALNVKTDTCLVCALNERTDTLLVSALSWNIDTRFCFPPIMTHVLCLP